MDIIILRVGEKEDFKFCHVGEDEFDFLWKLVVAEDSCSLFIVKGYNSDIARLLAIPLDSARRRMRAVERLYSSVGLRLSSAKLKISSSQFSISLFSI